MTAVLAALAMMAGLFLLLSGAAFFVVGLIVGRPQAHPWYTQYGWSALALTGAFYLLRYALHAY